MKKPILLAILAGSTTLASAAQADTINVFNWSDYIAEDTLAKFTEATGIAVNYDVFDSNDTLEARLLAGSSGFDVVVPTSDYMQRQIAAGVYMPLDKSKLPNLVNMDEALMARAADYDPGNEFGVIYMWGTTGIGYNVNAVAERLGEGYEPSSWDLIFDPEIAAQLADCGITYLDTPVEMLPAAMNYLGLDPRSTDQADFDAAVELLMSVRPHVRYFHSSQYISDLANGEICVAVGWSGDVFQARDRAEEAGRGIEIEYMIPEEGALLWFDMMAIPADAPNPDGAHAFINFIMEPEITADITNYVWYANANAASMEFVDEEVANDPSVFPPDEVKANLWTSEAYPPAIDRVVTRLWTRVRTGQ
ncbi:polyamine ABC transporter substrate-binding protein [Alkalilacustris brevis]|uniref:polyamine ABC transporter substrate-binding protein n=1 Tax=Alkalilacustris brevis TaxID=2026338 RepID=UPI000E0DC685|nr:polyamine ABC transporter substrate-binding protein [Alkalilacustris brevis]